MTYRPETEFKCGTCIAGWFEQLCVALSITTWHDEVNFRAVSAASSRVPGAGTTNSCATPRRLRCIPPRTSCKNCEFNYVG